MKKKLLNILMLGLLVVSLSGCGADTTQEAMKDEVTEEITKETTNEETDAEAIEDNMTQTAHSTKQEVEMDEATKAELTQQLLEENEMDTSVVEGTKATRGCTFTLPEGFEESADMEGMYVTKRYPIDASTIYYIEMNKDIALQLMTEETFLAQAQEQFVENGEMDVEVSLDSFERIEIDGYPAFRIVCSYMLDEVKFTHLEYVINADKSYIITYSQTSEYDRMEEFEASAATIKLEY
ncbi:MAG: hypothetical protein IJO97_06185 [Lachnospiraceae bacterium]|nr:hypothetical protein [Lachnospiraceae bacterium]